MSSAYLVELKGISAGYQMEVLNDLSFKVSKGNLTGILGPNGAGKSTLLKVISGLLIPQKGEVCILNRKVRTSKDRFWLRRQIGYLAQIQAPSQLAITVEDTVLLGRWGRFFAGYKRPTKEDYNKVREVLALVGMSEYRETDWRNLSGGQQQRVALARALVREPELLLMDEPTTYLDPEAQGELIELIQKLQQTLEITTIVVTHLIQRDWSFSESWEMRSGKLSRCV